MLRIKVFGYYNFGTRMTGTNFSGFFVTFDFWTLDILKFYHGPWSSSYRDWRICAKIFLCSECTNKKTYGLQCKHACGNCKNGVQCNYVNGSCVNGCDRGTYGANCDIGWPYSWMDALNKYISESSYNYWNYSA